MLIKLIKYSLISILFLLVTFLWLKGKSGGDIFFIFLNAIFNLVFVLILIDLADSNERKTIIYFSLVLLAVIYSVVYLIAPFDFF